MQADITKVAHPGKEQNIAFLVKEVSDIPGGYLSSGEIQFITSKRKKEKQEFFPFNRLDYWVFVQFLKSGEEIVIKLENCRKAGDSLASFLNEQKAVQILILDSGNDPEETIVWLV